MSLASYRSDKFASSELLWAVGADDIGLTSGQSDEGGGVFILHGVGVPKNGHVQIFK